MNGNIFDPKVVSLESMLLILKLQSVALMLPQLIGRLTRSLD